MMTLKRNMLQECGQCSNSLEQVPVVDPWGHTNEYLHSINGKEFLNKLHDCQLLKDPESCD